MPPVEQAAAAAASTVTTRRPVLGLVSTAAATRTITIALIFVSAAA